MKQCINGWLKPVIPTVVIMLICLTMNDQWSTADTLGFDMTHFLDHEPKRVLSAVMMVLFYRIELQLDGRLTSVFMDEGWQYLDHVGWQSMLRRWLATWRKLNAHIIFSTQSAHTVVQSSLCATLLDNVATMILFPNPQAQWRDYVDGLSLTARSFI